MLAICGLPLGDTRCKSPALMFNLLGAMPACAGRPIFDPGTDAAVHWHDYRKTPRDGRKIGHVTVTTEREAGLQARSALLAAELGVSFELNLEAVMQARKTKTE